MLRKRRTKNLRNLWLLLALPIAGVAGWAARRFIGRKKPSHAVIPISGNETAEDRSQGKVEEPANKTARDTVEKNAGKEPKLDSSPGSGGSKSADQAPSLVPPPAGHALKSSPVSLVPFFVLLVPFLVIPVMVVMLAFRHIPEQSQQVVPNGDANQGQALLAAWGCGACHTIPGIAGARGKVGPVLDNISSRSYIAGRLPNNPDNLVQWIMHPQEISPGVDMPDANVPDGVARDMAAYLYSLP